jgi:hypothetical protein
MTVAMIADSHLGGPDGNGEPARLGFSVAVAKQPANRLL